MKLQVFLVLELIVVVVVSTEDKDFNFDHAFRNFEDFIVNSNDQMALEGREAPVGLIVEPLDSIDRMGVAADTSAEAMAEEGMGGFNDFLRKLGDLQDQEAVEAKELSQFSSGWAKKMLNSPTNKKQISRRRLKTPANKNSVDRDDVGPLVFYEKDEVETTTEKKSRKSDDFQKEANILNKKQFKQKKAHPRSDLSHFPKEHRRQSSAGGFQSMMDKARSVVMLNTGNALDTGNVGTYLATMWISNIMQTVGFSTLGMMASGASSGRRNGYRSKGRGRSMNFNDDEQGQDEDEGAEAGFDIKFYTSMMRQIADFADTFHDEL